MSVPIPQSAPASVDRTSGGIVIPGCLNCTGGYLSKTFSTAGDRRKFTWSAWIKKAKSDATRQTFIRCNQNNENHISIAESAQGNAEGIIIYGANSGPYSTTLTKLRDSSGWMHLCVSVDTNDGTAGNRYKIYLNSELVSFYNSQSNPNRYYVGGLNSAGTHSIGANPSGGEPFNGGMSQVYFIDGQALGPEYFGFTDPLTGIWKPKKYENTIASPGDASGVVGFGTNGFYLPLDNGDDFEKDKSGMGNHWTRNSLSEASIIKDSPNGAAFGGPPTSGVTTTSAPPSNYAIFNPLDNHGNTLSAANFRATRSDNTNWHATFGSIPSSDGKHYFEVIPTTITTTCAIGVYVGTNRSGFNGSYPYDANTYMIHQNGSIYHNSSTYSYQTTYSVNDTVGVAIDSVNKKVWISVNGAYPVGDNPSTGAGGLQAVSGVGAIPDGDIYPVVSLRSAVANINFGQKPFEHDPPDGFKTLSSVGTQPSTVVPDPSQYVGVRIYDGNGGTQSFDLGMSPDFAWIKRRDATFDNMNFDTVRGDGKELYSDRNYSQGSPATSKLDFIRNGFNLPSTGVNVNTANYVAWFWKAGGKKNTFNVDDIGYSSASDAGLTAGNITPSAASVGTKQGFSIITYTGDGATDGEVPHGLNETPSFVIVKSINQTKDWKVHTPGLTSQYLLTLNENYAEGHSSWDGVTDTVFKPARVGDTYLNTNTHTYISYCWHDVPGLQKFGVYTCNGDGSGGGDEDGPFVELGFRPAMILFKGTNYVSDWTWIDEARCKLNYNDVALRANYQYSEIGNARGGEGSTSQPENYAVDFLSNGFKIRASGGSLNSGTNTVTYAAWAKSPYSDLYGGSANAR